MRDFFWLAQVKKDFLVAFSYKLNFFSQFFYIIVLMLPIFFLSETFAMTESPHLREYGNNYFMFAVLGLSFSTFVVSCIGSASKAIREAQAFGYVEIILNSKISAGYFVLTSMIYPLIIGTVRIFFFLIVAYFLQPFDLSFNSFMSFLGLSLLLVVPFIGIGLLAASYVILYKQGDPVVLLVNLVITVFSGTIYPVSVLPEFLTFISKVIPFTEGLDLIRKLIINNSTNHIDISDILFLLIFALVTFFIGHKVVRHAIHYSKLKGTLGRY